MLDLFSILRKLFRFPVLDLVVMCLSVTYLLFKPYGGLEQRQMLAEGRTAIAQVTRLTETIFGTFVDYTFISESGDTVKGTVKELDISIYGLTSVIPQTVELTYLPNDLDFVWLGRMEGQLETFWADFFRARWMDMLFLYAIWTLLLRWMVFDVRRKVRRELESS